MRRRLILLAVAGLIAALVPMAGASASGPASPEKTVDLIAGGGDGVGTDAGDVVVWSDDDTLYVKFLAADGWCLDTTHVAIAEIADDIPQKNGNPIPGKFESRISNDCVEEVIHTFDLPDYDPVIAAHAEMSTQAFCDEQGLVFGVEQLTGDLYEVNVTTLTATKIGETGDPAPQNLNSPNGLAYDPDTGTLYFSANNVASDTVATSELWKWTDAAGAAKVADVPGLPAGATIADGFYYYFRNNTDDLYKVSLADGTWTLVADEVTGNAELLRFGDIVIDGTTLYGSTNGPATNFFKVENLGTTNDYTEISSPAGSRLQLAFGGDDHVLYGASTSTGAFYSVNPADGSTALLGTPTGATYGFTDLASGDCVARTETGWGEGTDFSGKNWATYFTYTLHPDAYGDDLIWTSNPSGVEGIHTTFWMAEGLTDDDGYGSATVTRPNGTFFTITATCVRIDSNEVNWGGTVTASSDPSDIGKPAIGWAMDATPDMIGTNKTTGFPGYNDPCSNLALTWDGKGVVTSGDVVVGS